ncbi:hypothetical protein ACQPZG_02995 (plasmid) [Streptomyces sp. CA-294286]|uniref:hypothetical protein n=1 Tax=Streptomyces sp. CA-294286 TaxID=3240070 RepID=UPI003D94BE42
MSDDSVAECRCRHPWTVHLEGHCDGTDGNCACQGFCPGDWRPHTTATCRGCGHRRSQHGVSCRVVVGQDTTTERHSGHEGDTWTTDGTVEIRCTCQSFW